jgi:hypothetical protein
MQAQEAVFIRGDDFYTNAMSRGDSTAIKQAVYAAQKVLVDSTTDELWSVQPVTDYTVGLMHTFPGGWSMEGKQKKDRPLLYFPHQRPNGDKGVVAILMAVELKANEPLYTNPKEPYIFQQWFIDGEKRLGINIRKVAPRKKEATEEAPAGGDAVMEEAAAGAAVEAAPVRERILAMVQDHRSTNTPWCGSKKALAAAVGYKHPVYHKNCLDVLERDGYITVDRTHRPQMISFVLL